MTRLSKIFLSTIFFISSCSSNLSPPPPNPQELSSATVVVDRLELDHPRQQWLSSLGPTLIRFGQKRWVPETVTVGFDVWEEPRNVGGWHARLELYGWAETDHLFLKQGTAEQARQALLDTGRVQRIVIGPRPSESGTGASFVAHELQAQLNTGGIHLQVQRIVIGPHPDEVSTRTAFTAPEVRVLVTVSRIAPPPDSR